jgi:hypothetical protein
MLDTLWTFLKDPDNRDVLGWIGGGIVVVVGGLWAAVKFLSKKEHQASVQAINGGVAAGGDMIGNQINTGSSPTRKR